MSSNRRRRWPLAIAAALAAALLAPGVADADRRDDERAAAVARQRELVAEIDVLRATDEELTAAIAVLYEFVELKLDEVRQAQVVSAEAYLLAEEARSVEAAKRAEVEALEGQMAAMSVAAYVSPPQADRMETMLSSSAPSQAASLEVYLDVQNQRDTDLVRRLREARAALGDQRWAAEDAERAAQVAQDNTIVELTDLLEARADRQELQYLVGLRLGEVGYESGLISLGLADSNQAILASARGLGVARLPLVSVRGIRVHRSIAAQVEALLDAAEADGIVLGGGGFRTGSEQIALRRAHCGEDEHSIWQKPPGECSPPTALPGNSLHELGLAVDFTYRGGSIASRRSVAFRWLDEHAPAFGLYNLPSEPWHWSVDGT